MRLDSCEFSWEEPLFPLPFYFAPSNSTPALNCHGAGPIPVPHTGREKPQPNMRDVSRAPAASGTGEAEQVPKSSAESELTASCCGLGNLCDNTLNHTSPCDDVTGTRVRKAKALSPLLEYTICFLRPSWHSCGGSICLGKLMTWTNSLLHKTGINSPCSGELDKQGEAGNETISHHISICTLLAKFKHGKYWSPCSPRWPHPNQAPQGPSYRAVLLWQPTAEAGWHAGDHAGVLSEGSQPSPECLLPCCRWMAALTSGWTSEAPARHCALAAQQASQRELWQSWKPKSKNLLGPFLILLHKV